MSENNKKGLALAGCNYVGQSQIWKDHVEHEKTSAVSWERNWKFMATDYKDLIRDECPESEKKPIPVPEHLQIGSGPPLHECVQVLPSTKPVPRTTAHEIGWRSGEESLKLEKYGRYCRPKGGLIKQLRWPNEAVG